MNHLRQLKGAGFQVSLMTRAESCSDEDLVGMIAARDEAAFTSLYRRKQGAIFRFALQMTGCEARAEDVTQEVFLRLMRDPNRFDAARGSVSAFLYGIARKLVLQQFRKDRCLVQFEDEFAAADEARIPKLETDSDPLRELTRTELIDSVRAAVLALPEHYREVVVLCDLHELPYLEAAAILDCAVGTVKSRLHRARSLLAVKMRGMDEPGAEPGETRSARCFA